MISTKQSKYLLISAVMILLIFGFGYTADKGKIPITTSSEKAMQYYLQGRDLADRLQGQESREYFEKAIAEDPEFAMAYWNLAFALPTNVGFFEMLDKAKALVDKVSEGEKYMILATEAATGGEAEKQLNFLKLLVKVYPDDERAHNQLGTIYFGRQDYEMAIAEYQKAVKINPEFSPPYNQMGYAYRFLEKYDEAEKAFKKYIQLIPDDPNPYDSYAELLLKMGRHEESIENYQKALAINPHFVASHIGIATNYNCMNMHTKGRKQLQKMYDGARNIGERRAAHFARMVSYVDEGEMEKGLDEMKLQYALAKEDNDVPAMANDHFTIANILLEKGSFDEAQLNLDKAVKLIKKSDLPESVKANNARLYIYGTARIDAAKGDIPSAREKAAEFRVKAEKIKNPGQIRLAHELNAIIALEEKEFDTAINELKQANKQNPYNCYRMVLALEGKGEKEQAREMCHKACDFNALNNLNYAFIRNKAEIKLASM